MRFDWAFLWQSLFHPSPVYLAGLGMTVVISILAMALGVVLGLVLALMRLSHSRVLSTISAVYVWIMQGIPLLVVLVVIYLGLAAANIYKFQDVHALGLVVAGSVSAAIVGLTMNNGAYVSEIIRSAITAVPEGQAEASKALGHTGFSSMRYIILPQAVRTMIPPLGNQFNTLMKNTSLLSIIGVSELFLVTQSVSSATFKTFEIFLVTGVYYLLLTTVWTIVQNEIECHLSRQLGIPAQSMLHKAFSSISSIFSRKSAKNAPSLAVKSSELSESKEA